MTATITRLLIANRGEIAVRIIRTAREMGIHTIAIFSDADRGALHVQLADEAHHCGPAAPRESYLNQTRVLDIAKAARADAMHPGYGFLSENAAFAKRVVDAGLRFVGPSAHAIEQLGSKVAARRLATAHNIPLLPGANDPLADVAAAKACAQKIGYPILLKAAAGGGGKGMRVVESADALEHAFTLARGEALSAFGDDAIFLERFVRAPHHVEVQIIADAHGTVHALGERECSIQRRHQKLIEETPSPFISDATRHAMWECAANIARAAGYVNAGTVEFLVDDEERFYFLEVNTRLQVEHPVTELVTGLDLVRLQLQVAAGERLPQTLAGCAPRGHAIECRLCAEDPMQNFVPSPGTIHALHWPEGAGVRIDSGVFAGWRVPMEYDSMLAKICVTAATRTDALARMRRALDELVITGVTTNQTLLQRLITHPDFVRGNYTTNLIANAQDVLIPRNAPLDSASAALAGAALTASGDQRPTTGDYTAIANRAANLEHKKCWQQTARQEGVGRAVVS